MEPMTIEEAAKRLNGCEYTEEGTPELFKAMKDCGLVAVFGASDDLMEFRGAIYDEVGAWEGGTAYVTPSGLLENECDNDDCPHYARLKRNTAKIEAKWDKNGFSWVYETSIPHAKFVISEDGEPYCEGIVFALADVHAP